MWLEGFLQDARWAIRGLRRTPGFALGATLTLALGLGANGAVLATADRVAFRGPAHVVDGDQLYRVFLTSSSGRGSAGPPGPSSNFPTLAALEQQLPMSRAAAYARTQVAVGYNRDITNVRAEVTAGGYFDLLGTRPQLGRFYTAEDELVGGPAVAVISDRIWRQSFGADSAVVGRVVRIGSMRYAVVGVAPPRFGGVDPAAADIWLPLGAGASELGVNDWIHNQLSNWLRIVVRVPRGFDRAVAEAQVSQVLARANSSSPLREVLPDRALLVSTIAAREIERALDVQVSKALAVVSLCILIAACANVSGLFIARAMQRRRDLAMRLALGASRKRVAAQVAVESLLIASLGALIAVPMAVWTASALHASLSGAEGLIQTLNTAEVTKFIVVGAFFASACLIAAGALGARRLQIDVAIRAGAGEIGVVRHRTRSFLLGTQIVLTVVLVSLAELFVESLSNVRAIDTGIDLQRVSVVTWNLERENLDPTAIRRLHAEAVDRLLQVPGVANAAVVAKSVPMLTANGIRVEIPGRHVERGPAGSGPYYSGVGWQFFQTIGTRTLRGRSITSDDERLGARVMVINEVMARRYWPDVDPVGSCVKMGNDTTCTTVVGIVENIIKFKLLGDPEVAFFYIPLTHYFLRAAPASAVVVRSEGEAKTIVPMLRRTLHAARPDLPPPEFQTYHDLAEQQVQPWRLGARVLIGASILALIVSSLGVYAMVAYLATRRTREIGVRMALGAKRREAVRLILFDGLRVSLLGLVVGVIGSLVVGRIASSVLYGVTPWDASILSLAVLILLTSTLVAAALPALKASRIDPTVALRVD